MSDDRAVLNALCRQNFAAFAHKAFTEIEPSVLYEYNWHIGCISDHLMALRDSEIQNLIINLPPRCLKSFLVSVAFPAWLMGNTPSERIITASYAFGLAKDNVRRTRLITATDFFKECMPSFSIASDQNEKHNFETTRGGGYYGAGIGGSITGKGANYVIVDDPISPKEASSSTIRQSAIDEIRGTLFSRFNDKRNGKFIMVMQRLHEQDPTGDLLAGNGGDRYHHLKLPAEAKTHIHIKLGDKDWRMEAGELLHPERLTPEVLQDLRNELGEYNYSGQYQQEPIPSGGGAFQRVWFEFYENGGINPSQMNVYILYDAAGGEKLNSKKSKLTDYTAYVVVGLAPDNNYYLLDIIRDRMNPTQRIDTLFELHRKWNALCKKPPVVGAEEYGLMSDIHYVQEKQKQTGYRFKITNLGGRMQKEMRIERLIPDVQMGRWFFPTQIMYKEKNERGLVFNLVDEIINSEFMCFPKSKFDDMIDAMSRIYDIELGAVFPKIKPKTDPYSHTGETKFNVNWTDW